MTARKQHLAYNRLVELERVVELLNGQLRALRQELYKAESWPVAGHRRANFISLRRNRVFMSAVCNQRIRPNTRRESGHAVHPSH